MNRLPALLCCFATVMVPALAQFRSEARLVEVYTSVYDQKGNYVDGLTKERFQILDNGLPQPITTFEAASSDLSCAILLDTTGSMQGALPAVKNAVSTFLDQMRPKDSVAIFSFNTALITLQDFTEDKAAAKRAALRTRASGETALFDAIAAVASEISDRKGKKVIVLFTDGADNASSLAPDAAIRRVLKTGVPVYAVAEGDAVHTSSLRKQLREVSDRTGGLTYTAKSTKDIGKVFQDIEDELQHVYLMYYRPPPGDETKWRSIHVEISGLKDYKVRGKQGYYPD